VTTTVAVLGATGKLGSVVARVITQSTDFELTAQLNSRSDLEEMLVADIVVDASVPEHSQKMVEYAIQHDRKVLIGTSGWSAQKISSLEPLLAQHPQAGVIVIPNFSLGSAVASHLATLAARHFDSIEIVETHGVHKLDSPSGTAVNTAERIAEVRQSDVIAPHSDQPARGQLIAGVPVHSLRMNGVVAQQEVIFGGDGESITISHTTFSDRSYEAGILASLRAVSKHTGLLVGLDKVISLS
jgi:4-hydroxy-tetrahydrodipicolinate reductase